jgi:hypothetical protein
MKNTALQSLGNHCIWDSFYLATALAMLTGSSYAKEIGVLLKIYVFVFTIVLNLELSY